MDNSKAIGSLELLKGILRTTQPENMEEEVDQFYIGFIEAIDTGINAISRDKKQFPITRVHLRKTFYGCPNCHKVIRENEDYCPHCGQAIDWGPGK